MSAGEWAAKRVIKGLCKRNIALEMKYFHKLLDLIKKVLADLCFSRLLA